MAYMKDYTWGSNGTKSNQGSMNYNLISYDMAQGIEGLARVGAEAYIHYLHGVNPLNMVYLSNMYGFGADHGVNEFYHSWFTNGSPRWDRVGTSTYGPAPGFLTGGPNPQYDWDGCCPSGCGSSYNNSLCISEPITPPRGQPDQKSYKDFNTSWPLNSWSVTENSCGYQVSYIRLLSKFVTAGMDCSGETGGGALIDSCGVCAGGNTGIEPILDPKNCPGYVPVTAVAIAPPEDSPGDLKEGISIFPNPGDGLLHLESAIPDPVEMKLVDLSGKLLIEVHYTGKAVIDTGHLSPGTYMVVHTWNDRITRDKLIIY
jgi:endoglucanase